MRLIDADALIEQMEEDMEHMEEPLAKMFTGAAISDIKHAPTIEPERKTGRWIPSDSELEIKCNKCGKDFREYVDSPDYIYLVECPKFCPNCGADMRGEKDG